VKTILPSSLPSGILALPLGLIALAPLSAQNISLSSTMFGESFFSESTLTGSFARINAGDGSLGSVGAFTGDADGLYAIGNLFASDPGSILGTAIDLFPRESDFEIGSLTFDVGLVSGSGVEVVPILTIDLSPFWTSDPNRTSSTPGVPPTVLSDLSDHALGLWFFNAPGSIGFGALDASDTLTFTNGLLTSINLDLTTSFSADFGFGEHVWNGSFTVSGNQISFLIDDTASTPFGDSSIGANLTGTVLAVVPEPSSLGLLLGLGALATMARRRRS
jgi:hypothetical protein